MGDRVPAAMQTFDALLPPDMAEKAETVGVAKARMPLGRMLVLAVLAGAFIALGALFSTTCGTGAADSMPYGLSRLIVGLAFSLGLVLVVIAGAELFTGNNLLVMAWASGKVGTGLVLRSWAIVYVGNLIGALATAFLVLKTGQHDAAGGAVGDLAVKIAAQKCELEFVPAFFRGVLCNGLVCLAVWLSFSARSTTDRILSVIGPVTAFVACGFEHCVANMYFVPLGIWISELQGMPSVDVPTWGGFLSNLIPVTLGNLVGGAGLVGMIYWWAYRSGRSSDSDLR